MSQRRSNGSKEPLIFHLEDASETVSPSDGAGESSAEAVAGCSVVRLASVDAPGASSATRAACVSAPEACAPTLGACAAGLGGVCSLQSLPMQRSTLRVSGFSLLHVRSAQPTPEIVVAELNAQADAKRGRVARTSHRGWRFPLP